MEKSRATTVLILAEKRGSRCRDQINIICTCLQKNSRTGTGRIKKSCDKIYKMINWWLDKGLGGFRIDAIINIKKDTSFPSYEPDGDDGLVSCVKMVEETGRRRRIFRGDET